MIKRIFAGSLVTGLALASHPVLAQPFNTFDPVSMAMGGAGVALPIPANANLFNPALLSGFKTERDEDFALGFSLGARAYDPDELRDILDDVADDFDELDDLVDRLNMMLANPANYTYAEFRSIQQELVGSARRLDRNLSAASGKSAQLELGLAMLTNLPRDRWAIGLHASGQATVGARINYTANDSHVLRDLAQQVEAIDAGNWNSGSHSIDYDSDRDLTSDAELLGAAIAEAGLSFAKKVELFGQELSLGITPKYVWVETIYYRADINVVDVDDVDANDYRASHGDFNLDLGVLKEFANGLYAGLVAKNLIKQDYDTVELNGVRHTIALRPQLRAGLGYDGGWYRLGLDVDLTKNKPLTFENASRYVAIGGELSAWGWAQLRAGYRFDTENSDRSVASVGIGLSPFKVLHLDLAVAGNSNEIGVSTQLALTF